MRVTAMVLGIIWGLFLMFYALYVFFAGELTSAVGMGDKSLSMLGSVLTPILVFVGAGLAMRKPVIAAALFGVKRSQCLFWWASTNCCGLSLLWRKRAFRPNNTTNNSR